MTMAGDFCEKFMTEDLETALGVPHRPGLGWNEALNRVRFLNNVNLPKLELVTVAQIGEDIPDGRGKKYTREMLRDVVDRSLGSGPVVAYKYILPPDVQGATATMHTSERISAMQLNNGKLTVLMPRPDISNKAAAIPYLSHDGQRVVRTYHAEVHDLHGHLMREYENSIKEEVKKKINCTIEWPQKDRSVCQTEAPQTAKVAESAQCQRAEIGDDQNLGKLLSKEVVAVIDNVVMKGTIGPDGAFETPERLRAIELAAHRILDGKHLSVPASKEPDTVQPHIAAKLSEIMGRRVSPSIHDLDNRCGDIMEKIKAEMKAGATLEEAEERVWLSYGMSEEGRTYWRERGFTFQDHIGGRETGMEESPTPCETKTDPIREEARRDVVQCASAKSVPKKLPDETPFPRYIIRRSEDGGKTIRYAWVIDIVKDHCCFKWTNDDLAALLVRESVARKVSGLKGIEVWDTIERKIVSFDGGQKIPVVTEIGDDAAPNVESQEALGEPLNPAVTKALVERIGLPKASPGKSLEDVARADAWAGSSTVLDAFVDDQLMRDHPTILTEGVASLLCVPNVQRELGGRLMEAVADAYRGRKYARGKPFAQGVGPADVTAALQTLARLVHNYEADKSESEE